MEQEKRSKGAMKCWHYSPGDRTNSQTLVNTSTYSGNQRWKQNFLHKTPAFLQAQRKRRCTRREVIRLPFSSPVHISDVGILVYAVALTKSNEASCAVGVYARLCGFRPGSLLYSVYCTVSDDDATFGVYFIHCGQSVRIVLINLSGVSIVP